MLFCYEILKKMKLPKAYTPVTPLSKSVAIVLFVWLSFLGFYIGTQYQKTLDITTQRAPLTNWKPFIYADGSFSLYYPPIWYTVYSPIFSELHPPDFSGHFSFFDVGTDPHYSVGDTSGNEVLQIFLSKNDWTVSDFKRMDRSLKPGRIEETTIGNKPAVRYIDSNSIRYDIKPSPDKTITIMGVGKEVMTNIEGIVRSLSFYD